MTRLAAAARLPWSAPDRLERLPGRQAAISAFALAVCVGAGALAGSGRAVAGFGLLAAAFGAAELVRRPLLGGLLLASAVPALSGLNRGLPVPGLRLSEALIVGVALLTLLRARPDPWRGFDWAVLAYLLGTLGLGLFDLSGRGAATSAEDLGKLIGPLEFFLLYRTVRALARGPSQRRAIVKWLMLASIPVSLLAVMQFVDIPGTRVLASSYAGETDSLKSYHSFYRATALFAQGHLLDSYLMIVVLLAVASLLDSARAPLSRRALLGVTALNLLAMGATTTITPILGVTAGALVLAWWYRKLGRAALAIALAAACATLIFGAGVSARLNQETGRAEATGGTPSTLSFRVHVWREQFLPVIDSHLATGYGPDLPPGSAWEYTESGYVTLLLRGGLPLLAMFALMMWVMARRSLEVDDDRRAIARTMFVVIALLTVMHGVDNYFFDAGFPQVWWVLAGLLMASSGASARAPAVSARVRRSSSAPRSRSAW